MKIVIVSFPGMTYKHLRETIGDESVLHMDHGEFLSFFNQAGPFTFAEKATAIKEKLLVVPASPPVMQCLKDNQFPHWVVMPTREAAMRLHHLDVKMEPCEKFPSNPSELTRDILEAPSSSARIATLTIGKAPWRATMSEVFLWLVLSTLMDKK